MLKLKALDHVGIKVRDMDKTLRFYQALGLTVLRTKGPDSEGLRFAVLQVGSQEINVSCRPDYTLQGGEGSAVGIDHFCFEVDAPSIDDVIESLECCNVEIADGPLQRRDGAALFLVDPDGVKVELQLKRLPTDATLPRMPAHLRIARPVAELARSVSMYKAGLGMAELGSFSDHEGFDGAMLGNPGSEFHLEFTFFHGHQVRPTPTKEDLLVFYVPDQEAWSQRCSALLSAGFSEVQSNNPYWSRRGRTFEDPDGYRVVIQQAPWSNESGP